MRMRRSFIGRIQVEVATVRLSFPALFYKQVVSTKVAWSGCDLAKHQMLFLPAMWVIIHQLYLVIVDVFGHTMVRKIANKLIQMV